MKPRLILVAIVLLSLFSLKMGTGLLLHNLCHSTTQTDSQDHSNAENDLDYACHCIDDFQTPFAEASFFSSAAKLFYRLDKISATQINLVCISHRTASLRGPPACIA